MNIKNRLFLLSLASMLALLANLAFPNIAFADDETPPPVATGEPVQPPGEQPTEEPVSDPAMAIEQETLIPEVVGELPDGTEIVLLNEDGEAEPLATEEAAELLVNGDPMWCPSGVLPGGSGCTSSFTSFTDLITELTSFPGTYIGAGTIYVAWDYDATVTPDAGTDIIFDYGDVGLTDLVFQGGWDFGSNAVVGTSDLTGINSLQFWDWGAFGFPASLTLNDITLNGGDGLYIGYDSSGTTSGVTLDNVTVEDTNNGTYIETDGNVSIINSTFNDNDSDGLRVVSGGNITLEDVTASGNDGYGAFLDGCNCSGDSDIKITGTNEFNENEEGGLFAATTGDVHIEGVTASSNDGMGLYAEADGDITLKNVTANYNYYNGAWVDNTDGSGNVGIYNSNFDENVEDLNDGYAGLNVDSNGFVTLSGISASNNGGDGANIDYQDGNFTGVYVENSVFNDNYDLANDGWGYGLYIDSGNGNVILNNVTGLNNVYAGLYIDTTGNVIINSSSFTDTEDGYGAELEVEGDVLVCNSTFSDNDSYGIDADDVDGNLTLSDVTFVNNGDGDDDYYYGGSGTVTVTSGVKCIPGSGGKKPKTGGLPLRLVPVNDDGAPVELDCELYAGTVLILGNGDSVTFKCPIAGAATLSQLTGDGLPGSLPEGVEFVSGMGANQNPDGSDAALDGMVVISFVIPDGPQDFAILYWNGSEWVDLKDTKFEDGRKVIGGGAKTGDAHFEAITNFSGIFVLVTK